MFLTRWASACLQIHHIESEQWLGSLLHANDELVMALMTFEQLDRSIDADSDSDDELAEQAHMYRSKSSPFPLHWPLINLQTGIVTNLLSDDGESQIARLPTQLFPQHGRSEYHTFFPPTTTATPSAHGASPTLRHVQAAVPPPKHSQQESGTPP